MITVYALSSLRRSYIYVGMSSQFSKRVERHNKGQNKTTKPYAPFKLVYTKEFTTRKDARAHEKYLKSGVGREFLKSISKEKE